MKTILLSILLLVAGAGAATAQIFKSDVSKKGTTAASFLSIAQGARASSMGGAFVAVADDWSSLYWNPAGIASLGNGVMFDHTIWFADLAYNYVGATVSLGDLGTLGMSVTASSVGDMKVTTIAEPEGTGEVYNVSDVAFGLAYGIKLTNEFSIGFNPKLVYQRIWKMSASALAIDVGVKYITPFKGITLGMAISNFGQKMQMTGQNAVVLYDSDPSSSGNNSRIPAELSTGEWSLPLNFRVGVAYHPQLGDMHKITLAVDAMHPSDDYESVNVGGEYTFNDFVSFRGGYKALFLKDSEESLTLGVGVRQPLLGNVVLMADYAYADFGRLSSIHKITIGMSF
ncbi:MAG: PorV/PorQ family protein [Bacteroidota bacterium]